MLIPFYKNQKDWTSCCGSAVMNPTSVYNDSLILGPKQWVKDLVLPWLWCRPACRSQTQLGSSVAVAAVQAGSYSSDLISSLGTSQAVGAAL